jgi:hypothetical protein
MIPGLINLELISIDAIALCIRILDMLINYFQRNEMWVSQLIGFQVLLKVNVRDANTVIRYHSISSTRHSIYLLYLDSYLLSSPSLVSSSPAAPFVGHSFFTMGDTTCFFSC